MKRQNFSSLFQTAIGEWPEVLNLVELQHQDGERYSVLGLGKQLEEIEYRHIGSKEELIWRELHWAIFTIVHSLAKNLSELRLSNVREEVVQGIFRQRLQLAITSQDSSWNAEDFSLAEAYLTGPEIKSRGISHAS